MSTHVGIEIYRAGRWGEAAGGGVDAEDDDGVGILVGGEEEVARGSMANMRGVLPNVD